MKVVFIYPELSHYPNWKGSFHFGVAYISSVLKKAGHKVSLVHLKKYVCKDEFLRLLADKEPFELLAFSSTTNEFSYIKDLTEWAKAGYSVPVICGGSHATIDPEQVISHHCIDFVCIGEGELPMLELCNKIDAGKDFLDVDSLWLKRDGNIIRNSIRPLLENLDSLPFPDRELFNYQSLEEAEQRRLVVMASRGCPYKCSYCCNYLFRDCYSNKGKYVRFRSVDNIIQEIKVSTKEYGDIERIVFHDDIFPLDKNWFNKFIDNYSKDVNLPFICNSRANLIDEEVVYNFRKAGCIQVNIGIESGNEKIRKEILNRNISQKQILNAFNLCRKMGLRTYAYNMVGIPSEELSDMLDTVKLNTLAKPSQIQTSIFYPYPRTELYNFCDRLGLLKCKRDATNYFSDTVLNLPPLLKKQIKFISRYFATLVAIYSTIYSLPQCLSRRAIGFMDKFLSSKLFPYLLLIKLKPTLSLKNLLRSKFPSIYSFVRPFYKRVQYKYR